MLDCFVTAFLSALDLDLSMYLSLFPLLSTVYSVLQGLAVGLTAIVALSGLATFWLGAVDSSAMTDRPVNILLRSLIAGMLVYFGGHFLALAVELGTVPYDIFLNMDGASESVNGLAFAGSLLQGAAAIAVAPTYAVKDVTVALIEFLIIVLIAVNLFKLTLEVAERYMVVGLLVFTSPIVYPTLATRNTSRIMKNWVSMFCGSLVMMSASVIFLKLVVSGLNNAAQAAGSGNGSFLLRILLVLALCRIAQRVDNYLQQLGLTVASTGGSILEDILSIGSMASKAFNGGAKSSGVMGAMTRYASHTPIGQGLHAAAQSYTSGMSAKEAFTAGKKAAASGYRNTVWGSAPMAAQHASETARKARTGKSATFGEKVRNEASAAKAGASAFAEQMKTGGVNGAASGFARGIVHAFNPEMVENHQSAQDKKMAESAKDTLEYAHSPAAPPQGEDFEAKRANENASAAWNFSERFEQDPLPLTAEEKTTLRAIREAERNGEPLPEITSEMSERSVAAHGVTDSGGRFFKRDEETGNPVISDAGTFAGLRIDPGTNTLEAPSGRTLAAGIAAALSEHPESGPASVPYEGKSGKDGFPDSLRFSQALDEIQSNSVHSLNSGTALDVLQDPRCTLSGKEPGEEGRYNYVLETAKTAFRGSVPADMDEGSTRVTAFRSRNLPDTSGSDGNRLPGGREYTVDYADGRQTRSVTYIDNTAYTSLSVDERAAMRRFVSEGGAVLWFRAEPGNDGDIIASRRGKERRPSGYTGSRIGKNKTDQ